LKTERYERRIGGEKMKASKSAAIGESLKTQAKKIGGNEAACGGAAKNGYQKAQPASSVSEKSK